MPNIENRTKQIIVLPGVIDESAPSGTIDANCVVIRPEEIRPVPDDAWDRIKSRENIQAMLGKRKLVEVPGAMPKVVTEPDDDTRELLQLEQDEFVAGWPKVGLNKCKKFVAECDDVVLLTRLFTDEDRAAVHKLLEDRIGVLVGN